MSLAKADRLLDQIRVESHKLAMETQGFLDKFPSTDETRLSDLENMFKLLPNCMNLRMMIALPSDGDLQEAVGIYQRLRPLKTSLESTLDKAELHCRREVLSCLLYTSPSPRAS